MQRTQIYLQDSLHETLKARAISLGISMSELIRRTLDRDLQKDAPAEARAFFGRLKPLESFAHLDAQTYVRGLRSKSRLPRPDAAPGR
jgi:hypothetical protein